MNTNCKNLIIWLIIVVLTFSLAISVFGDSQSAKVNLIELSQGFRTEGSIVLTQVASRLV